MRIFITLMGIFTTLSLWAQTGRDSIKRSVNLDEVVISANKTEESKRFVASQINVINSKQIQFSNVQTTGDVLTSTGLIMLQKSQQGGGSPVIRGFEASRILLVVDGVRLNNLIYRGGHLQSAITIDPSVLDKVEVFFGPSSTVYGSDALGGTIHFMTKKPRLDLTGKKPLSVNAMQRYSSVNKGSTTHMNINFGFKKLASFTALTYNSFNNLRMGRTKNPFYDTIYGLRETYVTQMNGKDTILGNNNRYIQAQSGYKQIDMMQKFLYKPSHKVEHQVNVQYSNSTDIPRYDRLTESNNGQPTFAEWYYGPQVRLMTAYDLNLNNTLGFSSIHVGVSYQDIQESRYTRRFKTKIYQPA